jgi:hypothetical protein
LEHEEVFIHSYISKVLFVPLTFIDGITPSILIAAWGQTVLPVKTLDDLLDKIISRNFSDLLYDEKKKFKEIIGRELM